MATSHNPGFSYKLMEPGERIKTERTRLGLSQADLGRKVGISQVAVKKIESGDTRQSKHLPRIAVELGIDLADIDPSLEPRQKAPDLGFMEGAYAYGRRNFPIYAAAEGGSGEIIRSSDPVDWHPRPQPVASVKDAYGLYIVGESMSPEYRPGDIALVNPRLPIVGGEVYIFYAEQDGETRATIKHLRRATSEKWLVSQHNKAKDFELIRKEWQRAHRVIGKYSRQ